MKTSFKKLTAINMIRKVSQIIAFILFPGFFTSAFYAVKEIYLAIIKGNFTLEGFSTEIGLLMATILITLLMGRFFCGFLCAFGSMGDLLWFISRKSIKSKFRIEEKTYTWLKLLKYVILVGIVVLVWTLNLITFDSMSNPWTIFGMYATLGGWPPIKYLLSIGSVLLILIMVGSLFIERFFCRYLCPLGAIFSVVSKLRVLNITKSREDCGACKLCTQKCSMGISLNQYDKVTSGECINCFSCVELCPRHNVKSNQAPAVASIVAVALTVGLFYTGQIVSQEAPQVIDQTALESTTTNVSSNEINSSAGKYTDGTYTGSGVGFRGNTEVEVSVTGGNITEIEVVSYEDDRPYFERAKEEVIAEIISNQEVEVDAVAGATFSSNGIMEAVAKALEVEYTNTNSSNANKHGGHGRASKVH